MQSKINSLFNSFSFIPKSVDSSKLCSDQFNYKRVWKYVLLTYQRRPRNSSGYNTAAFSGVGKSLDTTLYNTNSSAGADFLAPFVTIKIALMLK
ncbi:hypothetical protein H5410_002819, partial [Solanum commersonii]